MRQTQAAPAPAESDAKLAVRAILRVLILIALCTAGGLYGYWYAWLFLGLTLVVLAVNVTVMRLRNPGLLRQRLKPDRPTKKWDRQFMIVGFVASIGIFVVAPLDFFLIHGPNVPLAFVIAGAVLYLGGNGFIAWVMGENPFLERTVRIQEERHQVVITTGPYAIVRHPMYTGLLVASAGWPLVLGSWWAFLPVLVMDVAFVVRTYHEDRTLHDELPGYREYAQKTRYRLLPGVW
ncbi:MAG: isoprenylcysteine carboxylmethyltransferase family protein [Polyangiaceae bacterium]|nr:isoprenylcysteine carboxylmethyltransferase family protein [Polyangiaceae bacterium]